MSGFLVLLCLGFAHADMPLTKKTGISMKVEEGNEMDETAEEPINFLEKISLSTEAKKEFLEHNTAFTAMKAYQMTGAASFGHPAKKSGNTKTIWVQSFGRSGSSTLYELILQAQEKEKLFSIFEPCANKDVFHGTEIDKNATKVESKCVEFMDDLQKCQFDDIDKLVHWEHKDSVHEAKNYGKLTATYECNNAGLRVFKTLNSRNLRADAKMQEEKHPGTKIVHLIRDPRGIWASQKEASEEGVFKGQWEPEDLCSSMNYNSEADNHQKVVTIKFEDLIRRPQTTARQLYTDLGLEFGEKQRKWVAEHFGVHDDCEETALSTCKRDSHKSLNKWKQVIDAETARKFSSGSCKRVFERYGYQWDTEKTAERGLKVKKQ
jgi:hypothetical protein